ncbi:hypothetical protein JOE11_000006 [Robbsia andropogonis]
MGCGGLQCEVGTASKSRLLQASRRPQRQAREARRLNLYQGHLT